MTRSPLSYPLNRGMDMDGGGAADLQTDVMRFMAILSLCLVAIFALVQSIPVTPPERPAPIEQTTPAPVPLAEPPPESLPARQPQTPAPPETPAGTDMAEPLSAPEPVTARAPAPASPAPLPAPIPAPEAENADEGFTLRFASDTALTALVAREEIGLYAIDERETRRLNIERGRLGFWQASQPGRYHEMDTATVPADVVAALRRSGQTGSVQWGVTLPGELSRQLDGFLSAHSGGELVIGADGRMRLEQK